MLAAAALGVVAASLLRAAPSPVLASGDGEPIMMIADERDAGAKEAEPTIYVLWPGTKKVEAFVSGKMMFMTYDFASRTVTFSEADIK